MISFPRQYTRAGGFDTPFAPAAPYFIAAPAASVIRKENLPPFLRKRIGFEQIKIVPIRWPSGGGPGGLSLYGSSAGGNISWVSYLIFGLAIYGAWIIARPYLRRRR